VRKKERELMYMGRFIPKEKLCKKARKELYSKDRKTWGNVSPITRKVESKKVYNRKKAQMRIDDFPSEPFLLFFVRHVSIA
jgi:hypothetical protein